MTYRSENLTVLDPFRSVRSDFSKLFGMPSDPKHASRITESDKQVVLQIDLPGIRLEDVSMTVEQNQLSISGCRKQQLPEDGRRLLSNSEFGEFQHSFQLHKSLDPQSIDAVMDQGVLTVTIAKHPEVLPQSIQIRRGTV